MEVLVGVVNEHLPSSHTTHPSEQHTWEQSVHCMHTIHGYLPVIAGFDQVTKLHLPVLNRNLTPQGSITPLPLSPEITWRTTSTPIGPVTDLICTTSLPLRQPSFLSYHNILVTVPLSFSATLALAFLAARWLLVSRHTDATLLGSDHGLEVKFYS